MKPRLLEWKFEKKLKEAFNWIWNGVENYDSEGMYLECIIFLGFLKFVKYMREYILYSKEVIQCTLQ